MSSGRGWVIPAGGGPPHSEQPETDPTGSEHPERHPRFRKNHCPTTTYADPAPVERPSEILLPHSPGSCSIRGDGPMSPRSLALVTVILVSSGVRADDP